CSRLAVRLEGAALEAAAQEVPRTGESSARRTLTILCDRLGRRDAGSRNEIREHCGVAWPLPVAGDVWPEQDAVDRFVGGRAGRARSADAADRGGKGQRELEVRRVNGDG